MYEFLEDRIVYDIGISIGDTVMPRKTGLPAMGKVIGIMVGPLFVAQNNYVVVDQKTDDNQELKCVTRNGQASCRNWDDLYPNWFLSPLCYVKFEQLQKTMSYPEFRNMRDWGENLTEDAIKAYYDLECPSSNVIIYPVDDLEKFE